MYLACHFLKIKLPLTLLLLMGRYLKTCEYVRSTKILYSSITYAQLYFFQDIVRWIIWVPYAVSFWFIVVCIKVIPVTVLLLLLLLHHVIVFLISRHTGNHKIMYFTESSPIIETQLEKLQQQQFSNANMLVIYLGQKELRKPHTFAHVVVVGDV